MSHVHLIAADQELPCTGWEQVKEDTIFAGAFGNRPAMLDDGICMVSPHEYYRDSVDELGIAMKTFPYEFNFYPCQGHLNRLLAYLRENFSPGEEVELWSLWVGSGGGKVHHYRGRLSEFDLDTLEMLYELQREPDPTQEFDDLICQVCVTVEI